MSDVINQVLKWVPETISSAVRNRIKSDPIVTVDHMAKFVQTRAAFVAQTSLFGYLKERMGTSYPKHFENEDFVESVRTAQIRVYAACAADLSIFTTANIAQSGLERPEARSLAEYCYKYALDNSGREIADNKNDQIAAFRERAEQTAWPQAQLESNAFFASPKMLVEAAPVINEFKQLDSEIVMNSIRFRWRDIREQFRKRAAIDDIAEDFLARKQSRQL
ncbi:MAG: hypothetical protein KTR19_01205 [Hyphomicrobiales bacterium]|nr:hypothetical protein [Hyphomicrobiales bacterium]